MTRTGFWLAFCLALAGIVWAADSMLPSKANVDNSELLLSQAWAVAADSDEFPSDKTAHEVKLPDDWSRTQSGYQGATWYRIKFDLTPGLAAMSSHQLLGAYIERACTNVEVRLNGQLVYVGGQMDEPVTRNCYRPHLFALPSLLLRQENNWLDLKVVGYPLEQVSARQRAGGLSPVRLGSMQSLGYLAENHRFWNITMTQIVAGILLLTGIITLMLAWVRRLPYLFYFGLANLGAALTSAKIWWRDVPVPPQAFEMLVSFVYAPLTALSVLFILNYAGFGLGNANQFKWAKRIDTALWLQCGVMLLVFFAIGPQNIFLITKVFYHLFALELIAAISYFLTHAQHRNRAEYWIMGGLLCIVILVVGLELAYQDVVMPQISFSMADLILPALFCFIAFRLIQVYAEALEKLQSSHIELERRIQDVTREVEASYNQKAQARIEKVAEKERKRIASDLHDDMGAKLLTIIHTSDSERISNLAREALEEMRLSVRGLTGRPVHLADAMADWRSETVSRLGETSIRVDWKSPAEIPPLFLSARTFVQTTRILREAVSNIIKHSGSSHCDIAALINAQDFQFVIHDNGRGIPLQLDGKLDRGHGMSSMKSRAKQLHGQCLVESGPNLGTIIRLTLPLEISSPGLPITATMSESSMETVRHEANPPP